ncbi:hypothetical protein WAI453_011091 [Rhynchosporium graminicola]
MQKQYYDIARNITGGSTKKKTLMEKKHFIMAKRERYRIHNEEEQEKYLQQQNEDAGYQNDDDVENYSVRSELEEIFKQGQRKVKTRLFSDNLDLSPELYNRHFSTIVLD